MSSRTPRGSLSGVSTSAAEVAADFEESLKDLQNNNRYEISNLTIIAKENMEHAQAISKALESHIKTTAASRKLPALFVLDSIVKNVGTPYTVYLGKNLFSTFMDAYTLVDSSTRRNMESLLKTWKEPVPGSIDPRPVFSPEVVRPIDNALLKAKTAAIQHQRPPQVAYRGTATPPQFSPHFTPVPQQSTPQSYGLYPPQQVELTHHETRSLADLIEPMPTPPPYHSPYTYPVPLDPHQADVSEIKRNIQVLIPRFQQKIAVNPIDGQLRSQLGALEALSGLLSSRQFTIEEVNQIRTQVSALSAALPPQPYVQSTPLQTSSPQWQSVSAFSQSDQPPVPPFQAIVPPQQSILPPSLPSAAVTGLQALLANVPKPSTPQMRAAVPGLHNATHSQLSTVQSQIPASGSNTAADLLSSLAKAGLINSGAGSTPAPSSSNSTLPPPASISSALDPTASMLKSLQHVLTPSQGAAPPNGSAPLPIPPSTQSLKTFRPELVHALYDAQANQCATCGRRFPATEEGREKKSRHLDWHFRTNQRTADPNMNRGHHRNWYVDEIGWSRQTDFDPSTTTASMGEVEATATKAKKVPVEQTVRAPPGMTKNTCNICFEEMRIARSEDQQDWVFSNATWHNGKIVHGTCLAEMMKPQIGATEAVGGMSLAAALASISGEQKERSATPDSLLGKRKAEASADGGGSARLRMS